MPGVTELVASGALLVGALLYVLTLPRWIVRAAGRLAPGVVFECPTGQKVLALTIDDSPSPVLTREILKVLKRHGCKATFFIIGSQAEQCPDILDEMIKDGHELANHTMVDKPSFRLPLSELERQMDTCEQLINRCKQSHGVACTGEEMKWFRPGHGWFTPSMLQVCQHKGYRMALGSVFGNDPWVKSPRLLKWYYHYRAYPGAIMIIHDGLDPSRFQTLEVLDSVLPKLRKEGYTITTVSELYQASQKCHFT